MTTGHGLQELDKKALDNAVFAAIQSGIVRAGKIEASVTTKGEYADPMRAVDRSLQRLRKAGRIKSDNKANWSVVK
mgnify:CR=1 FL=1